MKYIIMADGKGSRWNNYNGTPKHLININGETLLERTVRLIKKYDDKSRVIITSHDPRYEVEGAIRYEPKNNIIEIDRFTKELIEDNICFLYGDTYYSEEAIKLVINKRLEDITFFGTYKSIVAIRINDSAIFKKHLEKVRSLYINGKIDECIGWQIYQSYANIPFKTKEIDEKYYVVIADETMDFNSPNDFNELIRRSK